MDFYLKNNETMDEFSKFKHFFIFYFIYFKSLHFDPYTFMTLSTDFAEWDGTDITS